MPITCSVCGIEAKSPTRLPPGWKRIGDEVLCKMHKAERLRLRAITFPVASVDGAEWKEFLAALRASWGRATELANWAVRQLFAVDRERRADDAKMFPLPKADLYRKWTDTYHDRAAWAGAAQSANAIMHAVEGKYRKRRMKCIWFNDESLPNYRYAVPYPVHNAAWKAEYLETDGGKVPVVTITLDGCKWTVRLRGGRERSRQLKAFSQLASGEAIRGELAIYRQRSYSSHRREGNERAPGGGATVKIRIMVKLVAHLPKSKNEREAKGALEVRTGRKALLVAVSPNVDKPWLYHAFQLRRTIYCYDKRRQMVADDLKAEKRPASPSLRDWLQRSANKMNRRIDSEIRNIASMVVKYAVRQGLAEVVYNDDERRYFTRFDWGKLTRYLTEECEEHGIIFRDASGEVPESDTASVVEGGE